jgi:hypothetical protein
MILGTLVEAKVKNDLRVLEGMETSVMEILGMRAVAA